MQGQKTGSQPEGPEQIASETVVLEGRGGAELSQEIQALPRTVALV
jgi:hypothetical protein